LSTGQKDRYPLAVHDFAVARIEAPLLVVQGRTVLINVTIQSLGNVAEGSLTVALSFDNTLIGSQIVMGYACGCGYPVIRVLMFSWNTGVLLEKGVLPGRYYLTATLSGIPFDANPSNMTKTSSPIEVIGFPPTPLASLDSAGLFLTWGSAIISIGTTGVAVFSILLAHFRLKKNTLN
jgi:hypothetical protein